jgi:hypothetical protein
MLYSNTYIILLCPMHLLLYGRIINRTIVYERCYRVRCLNKKYDLAQKIITKSFITTIIKELTGLSVYNIYVISILLY